MISLKRETWVETTIYLRGSQLATVIRETARKLEIARLIAWSARKLEIYRARPPIFGE